MSIRTSGGRGAAIGPLTARVVAARYEVGGLRLHEALFDLYDTLDRRLNATIGFRAALGQVITRRPLVERLQQIFRSLRALSHPNVVEIRECFQEVSQMYITQEFVQGPSLMEWMELRGDRRFSPEEGLSLAIVLCQALAAGHAAGLVHGGINPDGIRFAEPIREQDLGETIQLKASRLFLAGKPITPKFMNYGLGPVEAGITSTRKSYGLQAVKEDDYLPPEQQAGLGPEPRSDFYSLGSLIHFCVTGRAPTGAAARVGREGAAAQGTFRGLHQPLIPVLTRALQRSPAERFPSAEEMSEALQSLLDYFSTHPSSESPPVPEGSGAAETESVVAPPDGSPSPVAETPPARPPAGSAPATGPAKATASASPAGQAPSEPQPPGPPGEREAPPGRERPVGTPPVVELPPRRPYPESGVLPKVERDPTWRPPLRASSREAEPPPPRAPTPSPSPPPGAITPLAAPPTAGLPARLHRTVTPLGIIPEMVLIPGGTYLMGGEENEDERPTHPCTVDPFYMAVHPVTNDEYRAFVLTEGHPPPKPQSEQYAIWDGTRFSHEQGRRPVVHISWDDAVTYCQWLSELTDARFRLPTEAEWERAARGGLEGKRYPWGDPDPTGRACFDFLWTGPTVISEVCSFPANAYGLFDMSGLVWEWCRDFYHRRYYELPEATEPNPVDEAPSIQRVQRGGAWLTGPRTLRCAFRGKHRPDSATVAFGFRIVREV